MLINSSALSSLQIFAKDSHANMHSSDKPDGLSLHSGLAPSPLATGLRLSSTVPISDMLNLAKTQTGKSLMKRWMLQPSLDIAVLNARYDAVECFSHEDNREQVSLWKHLSASSYSLTDVRALLQCTPRAPCLRRSRRTRTSPRCSRSS